MPLPNQVIIGPLTYRVTDAELDHLRAVAEESLDTWGRIHYGRCEIVLDFAQGEQHKRMALLHECLHGCWHLTDRAHDNDEAAILMLAGPLLDMLRRNPDLVAYLTETEAET